MDLDSAERKISFRITMSYVNFSLGANSPTLHRFFLTKQLSSTKRRSTTKLLAAPATHLIKMHPRIASSRPTFRACSQSTTLAQQTGVSKLFRQCTTTSSRWTKKAAFAPTSLNNWNGPLHRSGRVKRCGSILERHIEADPTPRLNPAEPSIPRTTHFEKAIFERRTTNRRPRNLPPVTDRGSHSLATLKGKCSDVRRFG